MAATPSAWLSTLETSTYSSMVVPQTLTNTRAPRSRSSGSFSLTKRCTPMPCRPIALIIPAGVSTMRGGAWPFALGHEEALHAHAAERRQIGHLVVLEAVAEAAARGNHGIGQGQRPDTDGKITSHQSHTISAASNTGPLMHERTKCAWAVIVLHLDHAAVAAAQAAAHGALHGHLARLRVSRGNGGHRCQHRLRSAGVDHRDAGRAGPQRAVERNRHPPALASRSILGRQHHRHAQLFEEIQVEELLGAIARRRTAWSASPVRPAPGPASRTAPDRRRRPPSRPRVGAATGVKGCPSGPRQAIAIARLGLVEAVGGPSRALVQDGDGGRLAMLVAHHFEDRERPPQKGLGHLGRAHHDELPGLGAGAHFRARTR